MDQIWSRGRWLRPLCNWAGAKQHSSSTGKPQISERQSLDFWSLAYVGLRVHDWLSDGEAFIRRYEIWSKMHENNWINLRGGTKASKISKSCVCKTFQALGLPSYKHCSYGIAGSSSGQKTSHIAVLCWNSPRTHGRTSGDFHVTAVAEVGTAKTLWFPHKRGRSSYPQKTFPRTQC